MQVGFKTLTPFPPERWLVQYTVWAKCHCYTIRRVLWIKQVKEPTMKQILKLIDESNDKQ